MAGSGFQLDSNQLTQGIYRVVFNTSSNFATSGTAGGGVNPFDWDSSNYTNASAMSSAQALLLAQGNVRWNNIVQQLAAISDCRILDIVISGATNGTDATAQNTQVAFTVEFDRDAFILPEYSLMQKAAGASSNGTYTVGQTTYTAYNGQDGSTAITSTALAIQDIVALATVAGGASAGYSRTYRVYSPAQSGDSQVKVTVLQPCTPAQAFANLTVTQISGTTLAGTPL